MIARLAAHAFNAARGALMGVAEAIPGISGGTIALVVGIYETVIGSAGHVVSAIASGFTGLFGGRRRADRWAEARAELRLVNWAVIIPVLVGMAIGLVAGARFLEPVIAEHHGDVAVLAPWAGALFFGMILAALVVPFQMVERWRPGYPVLALAVAAIAFFLTGLPGADIDPTPWVVAPAAAVAVCALVLPGVSGSFFLLMFGLYLPTLQAVNQRDLGYLATFAAGAIVGLAVFVKVLQWLLARHHAITLVVLLGLMAGSLRSLWPWQNADRTLRAPDEAIGSRVGLMILGATIVAGLLVIERQIRRRSLTGTDQEPGRATVG